MIKKILYVGSKYENSIKENGDSLNKKAFYDNFLDLGYEVVPIWYDIEVNSLEDSIINKAAEIGPDIIFFILQKDQVSQSSTL